MARKRRRTGDFSSRLHSAAIRLLRKLRTEDEQSALSPARLSILSVLVFGGQQSISKLAHIEQLRVPTVSRLVVQMEEAGLVKRLTDRKDARIRWISATAKGEQLLEAARLRRIEKLDGMIGKLSRAEKEKLLEGVRVLESLLM